ncbi:10005_t:CDS:1, partial [Racocetra persica]
FISGYVFSNSRITTKISLAIWSIAFSRLIEHMGHKEPEKINTLISLHLNWGLKTQHKYIRKKIQRNFEKILQLLQLLKSSLAQNSIKKVKNIKDQIKCNILQTKIEIIEKNINEVLEIVNESTEDQIKTDNGIFQISEFINEVLRIVNESIEDQIKI